MSEPTLEEQVAALQAKLDKATSEGKRSRPADPWAQEQAFGQALRDVLNWSRTRWVGEAEQDDG